jgi:hypothetical protein
MLQKTNDRIMFTDRTYARGKKLVQVWIPACSTLYFGLGNIWGFPAVEEVVGSFAVLATFLGVCLGISSSQYDASEAAFDGNLVIKTNDEGRKLFSLEVNGDPEDF